MSGAEHTHAEGKGTECEPDGEWLEEFRLRNFVDEGELLRPVTPLFVNDQAEALEGSPDDKLGSCSMPEAGDEHCQK